MKERFHYIILVILIPSICGFGMFWMYNLIDVNVFISIYVGCLISSLVTIIITGLMVKK